MLLAGPISHTSIYSDHSILECYNLFSGVELSMRSFFVICGPLSYSEILWRVSFRQSLTSTANFILVGTFSLHEHDV